MVPLLNSTSYPIDLEENAIQFIGEEDGNFSNQDYILILCRRYRYLECGK